MDAKVVIFLKGQISKVRERHKIFSSLKLRADSKFEMSASSSSELNLKIMCPTQWAFAGKKIKNTIAKT